MPMQNIKWNKTCPICNKSINYWPNYSESTSADYGNVEWMITGSGQFKSKQFFHRSCYKKLVCKE